MSDEEAGSATSPSPPPFRTIAVTTAWTTEEAEQVLAFLDALRRDLWACYGEQIERARHEDACADAQCLLDLDEPPF